MANFVGVVDPDPERRTAFAAAAAARAAPLPGLVKGDLATGDLAVVWAAGARAPVSRHRNGGAGAVLLGDAIPGPGPGRIDAASLLGSWLGPDRSIPAAFDGFYAALAYSGTAGLRLGCDILGMFPVYWWSQGDVTLFGSSAALFPLHPSFQLHFEPRGLAGILTLNGLIANRPIYRGVRRLDQGCVLAVTPGRAPEEVRQYDIPDATTYHDLAFTTLVELLDETLTGVMTRLTPASGPVGLLLSGGLDSRMLAGLLHRQGKDTTALTLGVARDIEARCATRVARTLGFRHTLRDDLAVDAVGSARTHARWEHLSAGFFGALGWATPSLLESLPPHTVAGYALDFLMSPKNPGMKPGQSADNLFQATVERSRRWGLPPEVVGELLGEPRIVDSVLEESRQAFVARSPRPVRARARHHMANRARFHLGSAAWRMSFVTWPVFPVLDRALQALVAGLPVAVIAERRGEQELIRTRFPALARLPLDRNSFDTTPLEPPTAFLFGQAVARRTRTLLGPLRRFRSPAERRYYYRTADFSRPAWRSIRRAADPARTAAAEFIDRAALDRVLPGPEIDVAVKDPIIGTNGLRSLTGFLLWSENVSGTDRGGYP